jgi:hypothetical protein
MRVVVKIRVGEIRNLRRSSVELHHICSLNNANIGPGTPFIDAEDGRQIREPCGVHV